ncbi:hypothetical protein ACF0H5_019164 [Mactra antiquata]
MTVDTLPLFQDHCKLIRYNNKIYKWKIKYDTDGLKNCYISEYDAHCELERVLRAVLYKIENSQPLGHIVTQSFIVKPVKVPWKLIMDRKFRFKWESFLYKAFNYVLEFHVSRNHSRYHLKDTTNCNVAKESTKENDIRAKDQLSGNSEDDDVPDTAYLDKLSLTGLWQSGKLSDSDDKLAVKKCRGKSPVLGDKRIKKSGTLNDNKLASGKKQLSTEISIEDDEFKKNDRVKVNKSLNRHTISQNGSTKFIRCRNSLRKFELENLGTMINSKLRRETNLRTKNVNRRSLKVHQSQASKAFTSKKTLEKQSCKTQNASKLNNNSTEENTDKDEESSDESKGNIDKEKVKNIRTSRYHLRKKFPSKSLRRLPHTQKKKASIHQARRSLRKNICLSNSARKDLPGVAMETDSSMYSNADTDNEQNRSGHSSHKRKIDKKNDTDDNSQRSTHSVCKKKKLYAASQSQDSSEIEVVSPQDIQSSKSRSITVRDQDIGRLTRRSIHDSEKAKNATQVYSTLMSSRSGDKINKEKKKKEPSKVLQDVEPVGLRQSPRSSPANSSNQMSNIHSEKNKNKSNMEPTLLQHSLRKTTKGFNNENEKSQTDENNKQKNKDPTVTLRQSPRLSTTKSTNQNSDAVMVESKSSHGGRNDGNVESMVLRHSPRLAATKLTNQEEEKSTRRRSFDWLKNAVSSLIRK